MMRLNVRKNGILLTKKISIVKAGRPIGATAVRSMGRGGGRAAMLRQHSEGGDRVGLASAWAGETGEGDGGVQSWSSASTIMRKKE